MTATAYVKITQQSGYASIEFASPRANSMPGKLLNELADAIKSAGQMPDNKALLLQSAGSGAFCAGADFEELSKLKNIESAVDFFMGFARVIQAIVTAPVFVLGRAQGKAVGGGVGILAACDYVIAHSSAAVALTELKLGLGPYVIGPVVERKIGFSAFQELAVSSAFRPAEWCLQKGLYQEVHSETSALDQSCADLLLNWAQSDRSAIEKFKSVSTEDTAGWSDLLKSRSKISATLTLSAGVQSRIKALLK